MVLTHYIITRFSILDPTFKGFRLTRENNATDIENILFSKTRLEFKFNVFENMTYPSILKQTCKNYIWLIYTSTLLPQAYKERLEKYATDRIKIIYVSGFAEFNRHKSDTLEILSDYSTLRLDDDDGLCPTFLETINRYEDMKGKILTAPIGVKFQVHENTIVFGNAILQMYAAQGLTAIGFDIFSAGNHTTVNERFDVLTIGEINYYQCCSEFCDTKREFK
jgi:hypothetical protein